jgi:SP family myo-inositol transporter-like MFS transporter 13
MFGRRKMLIASDVLYIIGGLILWTSSSISTLFLGRMIVGLGLGMSIMLTSVYLSECSPSEVRGGIVANSIFGIFVGLLCGFGIGILLEGKWALMMGIAIFPAIA